ncbi:TetR family transcriptional regulator [Gammaproteobacteria bacterium]|nr:TetR family transcriptional regulator [Gammaproteobacteria bacterium]
MSAEEPVVAAEPGRKRQQRSVVTQRKLLDAAVRAFSESGFKGTSTRDIADRAGVHHPLITYHFKSKNKLWRAAADNIFREFNISLLKAMADVSEDDAKARAETFIRTYVRYAHRQPALHKFILQESSYPSQRLDWLIETHLKPMYETAVTPLRQLQDLGIAPAGDPALLYNMIRVSAGGLLALALEIRGTTDVDLELEEQLDELSEMIIRVFLPGNPPPDPD